MSPLTACRRTCLAAAAAIAAFVAMDGFSVQANAAPSDPAALLAEVDRLVRENDVARALVLLRSAIDKDPSFVDAHLRYQDLARDSVAPAALRASYADAAKARPDDPVAQYLSARLLPAAQAAAEFKRHAARFPSSPWPHAGLARASEDLGRLDDAAAAWSDAVRFSGKDIARFFAWRAWGFERTSQWESAADAWKSALDASPKDVCAQLGIVEAWRRAERTEEALDAVDAAAELAPRSASVAYRRALVQIDAGDWSKALAALDAAISLDRGMIDAYGAACEVGIHWGYFVAESAKRDVGAKDFEKAASYGERVAIFAPDDRYAHFAFGAVCEAQGEFEDGRLELAMKEYDAALARTPAGPEQVRVLTAKSWVHIRLGDPAAGLATALRAIDVDRNSAAAYGLVGHALAATGKSRDAIDKGYRQAVRLAPQNARHVHAMGLAMWEAKRVADARKAFEEARNLDPENGRYRLSLGELHYHAKRAPEAVAELSKAVELMPRSLLAWRAYGRACYAAKDWAECVRAYEQVTVLDAAAADEHLILAVVWSEQLKDREKAKRFARKWRQAGGKNPNLDAWVEQLLGDVKKAA